MPAKKAKKKAAAKKSSTAKYRPCTQDNICQYLEDLSDYIENDLWSMIRELRRAVCNLESVVLDGKPSNNSRRLCKGGAGDEPADPPKPPHW